MHVMTYGATEVGRVRDHNEDSYHVGETVLAVADGLGGHAAGEVASSLALEPVAALDGERFDDPDEAGAVLREAIAEGNRRVLADAETHPERAGMGTTLTAALLLDEQVVLGHVGDSRAYLWRGDSLEQLTTDHTVVEEALMAGDLTAADAARHPARHTLTRAVGLDPEVDIDVPPAAHLRTGDRLLLCSDGLTEVVADRRLAELFAEHDDPEALGRALIAAALAGGGPDNVTVVVARFEG